MIPSRWKKVFADLWGNKIRAVLTIITIAVGTFAVGFTNNLSLYMSESMESDFLSANPSEATISAWPMDDNSVRMARQVPGVDAVEGRSMASARLLRAGSAQITVAFTAVENPTALTLNTLKPAFGENAIPQLGDKEILFDSSAAGLGYKAGDTLRVELDDGKQRELRLVGYMHDAAGIPYQFSGNTVFAYVTPHTMEWLGGSLEYSQLAVSVSENPTDAKHVTEVAQAVADRIKRSGATVNFVRVYQPGHHFAYATATGMFFVLGVLGWLTVLLGCLLIINTITALMAQQVRQIGIMKATGADTWQLLGMYITLVILFGMGGLLLAIPLANRAAETIGDGMAAYLNFFPAHYRGYTSTILQQAIVAIGVPILAGLWPLYSSVRISVREALSDYGIGTGRIPRAEKVSKIALLLPRPLRLSLRNAFRRRLRVLLTLFTLVLAGSIFIAVYNLWASFDKVIKDIEGYFLADVNLGLARGYRFDRVADLAMTVPGVRSVEGWLEYFGTLDVPGEDAGRQIIFVAPPSDSELIKPIIASGRWLQPGDQNAIVIGNHLLNMFPDLRIGDMLQIEIDGQKTNWEIVGTYTITGNSDTPLLYANYEYISRLIGRPDQIYSLRVITEGHDAATQSRVRDGLLTVFEQQGIHVGSSQLSSEFIASQTATTDIFVYFMLTMAVLIAIVGGLGLMGTMSINVLERTREIGVMRAIGASNADIQGIVITEGLVIGMISWIAGIALSVPITVVLATGVGQALLTAPMPAVFGLTGILVWLACIIGIGTLASALPAHRASSLTVRDTLAYE
jgi:putative ABC transport system permease protein